MPKLPPFDEWERPWKEDEFDADKAAKLIYNLHKDKERLTGQVTTLKGEKATLQDELDDANDELETSKGTKGSESGKGSDDDKIKAAVDAALAAAGVTKKSRKEARKEAEKVTEGTDLRAERLEIALEFGLSKSDAMRLVGKNREELEADAEVFMEEHGLSKPGDGDGEGEKQTSGKEGQAPPSQRTKVKTGSTRSGSEAPDPDANLDPGALYDKVLAGSGAGL